MWLGLSEQLLLRTDVTYQVFTISIALYLHHVHLQTSLEQSLSSLENLNTYFD